MKKEDKRIRYTKMFLKESLLELMKNKPIDQITTTELCRKAEINRNTFYSHFKTVRDVLEMIEEEIEQVVISGLDFKKTPEETVYYFIQNIHDSSDIYKILLSPNGDLSFMRKLFDQLEQAVTANLKKEHVAIEGEYMHYLFSFIFFGSIAIIRCWLDNEMKQSTKDITKFILGLISSGMKTFNYTL